jgi:hypothetical protein
MRNVVGLWSASREIVAFYDVGAVRVSECSYPSRRLIGSEHRRHSQERTRPSEDTANIEVGTTCETESSNHIYQLTQCGIKKDMHSLHTRF